MGKQRENSFFARLSDKALYFWRFVTVDVWKITENKLHINIIKTVNATAHFFVDEQLQSKASALTYNTILAIVPVLALLFAFAKGFGFQNIIQSQLFDYFPAQREALEHALQFVDAYLSQTKSGVFVGIGLVFLFWTLISLLSNIESAFNNIWDVKGRSFYRKVTDYTSMFIILPILMISSSGLSLFVSASIDNVVYLNFISPLVRNLLSFAPYVLTSLFFTAMYIFIPNTKVKFTAALISGVICGCAFQIFQFLYISGQIWVSKYNAIYGSFAFLPLLLLWLQLSWLICLFGALLTYSIQNVGKFSFGRISEVSRRNKDFVALVVATYIVKRFEKGEKPYTISDLYKEINIYFPLVAGAVELLENSHVIIPVTLEDSRTVAYLPAIDIQTITVKYVLDKIERHTNDDEWNESFILDLATRFEEEWRALYEMRECQCCDLGDMLLKDFPIREVVQPVSF